MKFHKIYSVSFVVFFVAFSLTWFVWQDTRQTLRLKEEAVFLQEAQEIEDVIRYRLDDYTEVLFGLKSLFATEENMTSRKWNTYCENLELSERVPGIQSLRYSVRIVRTEVSAFIQKIRTDTTLFSQGFPNFSITHELNLTQQELYVVTYLWPWQENKDLHGLDMFSVSERRAAIEQARDSGKPAISSKIETLRDRDHPPGFVMYLPVYKEGAQLKTIAERRAAIIGIAEARFNASEWIDHTLSRMRRHPQVDVEIFDGAVLTPEHLYYNDDTILHAQYSKDRLVYSKQVTLDIYGHAWTLFFSSKPKFHLETAESLFPWIALGTGILSSLFLTGIVFALTTSQIRATHMAERMTKELEQQRALSMRSDRLRSLGEMAAGIAHELNQPLVGVRGLAEHLLIAQDRGWRMDAQTIRTKVSTIIEQADRMVHIIEHIRIFAREAGKPELRPINVNDVVESSITLLGAQFSSHGLRLETSLAPQLPPVLVNPFSLEEVIVNLLINARDAVEERLQAESEMHAPGVWLHTSVSHEQGQEGVRIEVTDNGIGIPAEIQEKIFDPFFTTKGPDKGTGLGLAISKTIVEEFGGTLAITSVPQQPTTATVTLPVEKDGTAHGTHT